MSQNQTAINASCSRWLADILEHRGVTDPYDLAEHVTRELISRGLAPVPRPFPLRPTAPVASEEARQAARDAAAAAVAAAKARRHGSVPDRLTGRPLPTAPPTPAEAAAEQAELDWPIGQPDGPCHTCERSVGHQPGCPDDPATPCPWPTCSLPFGHDQDEPHDQDDVVEAVIHEADCPGGDCNCGDDEPDVSAFSPDDPPF